MIFSERFHREARAVATLNHPNIRAVYQMSDHVETSTGERIVISTFDVIQRAAAMWATRRSWLFPPSEPDLLAPPDPPVRARSSLPA